PERPKLAPLFAGGTLSPTAMYAAAVLAEGRQEGALIEVAESEQLSPGVRRFALKILQQMERWDALEALARSERASADVRLAALPAVLEGGAARGLALADALAAGSAITAEARALANRCATEILTLARDAGADREQRFQLVALLAAAGRASELVELIR